MGYFIWSRSKLFVTSRFQDDTHLVLGMLWYDLLPLVVGWPSNLSVVKSVAKCYNVISLVRLINDFYLTNRFLFLPICWDKILCEEAYVTHTHTHTHTQTKSKKQWPVTVYVTNLTKCKEWHSASVTAWTWKYVIFQSRLQMRPQP
jgi:hypothetical protein